MSRITVKKLLNSQWTYGVEHEFGDWPRNAVLPPGFCVDDEDVTIMNSDGTAADPRGKLNELGGEINTPPSCSPHTQGEHLQTIRRWFPSVTVNHRSNLHVHVLVPGLNECLDGLKRIQAYTHEHLPALLDELVEPIPRPTAEEYPDPEALKGALRRYRRRLSSHHTFLTPERLQRQLAARTVPEFFEREVPSNTRWEPQWHQQARCAVNLRHVREEIPTIEFRHFPGTLCFEEVVAAVCWCSDFLEAALLRKDPEWLHNLHTGSRFPKFPRYDHQLECRYRATVCDGTVPREKIIENIRLIREGRFD